MRRRHNAGQNTKSVHCWLCSSSLLRIKKPTPPPCHAAAEIGSDPCGESCLQSCTHTVNTRTHTLSSSGKLRFGAHLKISSQVQEKSKSHSRRNTGCVITFMLGEKCCCEQFVRWSAHLGADKQRGSILGCSLRGYGCNQSL